MILETLGSAVTPQPAAQERRTGWALGNVALLWTGAVLLFALVRVFRVAHNDPITALSVFTGGQGPAAVIGVVLSEVQQIVELSFLLALVAFMDAEYPRKRRNEREVQALASVLVFLWVLTVAVGHFIFAAATLLFGVPFVIRRLIAHLRGDPYIKDEDRPPAREVTMMRSRLQIFVLILAVLFTYRLAVSDQPWLPPSAITTEGDAARTGYVVAESSNHLVVLWDEPRAVTRIALNEVEKQQLCRWDGSDGFPTLLEIAGDSPPVPEYRQCPAD